MTTVQRNQWKNATEGGETEGPGKARKTKEKFNMPRVHVDGSFYIHSALHKHTYTYTYIVRHVRFVRGGSYSRFTESKDNLIHRMCENKKKKMLKKLH